MLTQEKNINSSSKVANLNIVIDIHKYFYSFLLQMAIAKKSLSAILYVLCFNLTVEYRSNLMYCSNIGTHN